MRRGRGRLQMLHPLVKIFSKSFKMCIIKTFLFLIFLSDDESLSFIRVLVRRASLT